MPDHFDFPQPSKRRRISTTYATRRSTLASNQQSSPVLEGSRILRKSSRNLYSDVTLEDHSASKLDDNEPVVQDLLHLSLARSPLSHESYTNTTFPANSDSVGKRQQPPRESHRITAVARSTKRKSQHEDILEPENSSVEDIVSGPESTTVSIPVYSDIEKEQETRITAQPRSSGRERKRPLRYSISPQKPKSRPAKAAQSPVPDQNGSRDCKASPEMSLKGILTPSRRGEKQGPRKSVVFDREGKNVEYRFGFKDIGSSVRTTQKAPNRTELQSVPMEDRIGKMNDGVSTPQEAHDDESSRPTNHQEEDDDMLIDQIVGNREIAYETNSSEIQATTLLPINDTPSILAVKTTILGRMTKATTPSSAVLPHLQSQYTIIHDLLAATVTAGESNSLLLLGSRGSGKSQLLAGALAELDTKYHSDFHVVHLNGFFQTDDRIALREIWRQLGREMNVDEDETDEVSGSYADTMASLLSLLSHPEEFGVVDQPDGASEDADRQSQKISKSIVFVLDEFDLFTTHPRQTLLYNLFDIAQSRKAPIAVIGCSTRMDVIDCLEKRVKSRFSHRWVHVPSSKSLDGFQEILKGMLLLEEDSRLSKLEWDTRRSWNRHIESTFLPSSAVQTQIKRVYNTSKSLPELFPGLYILIATLRLPVEPSWTKLMDSTEISVAPTVPSILTDLLTISTLHLSLLIAAARLDAIHNLTTVNFNLVYNHYSELITRSKIQQTASGALAVGAGLRQWNRETAKGAWEDLSGWHMVVPATIGSSARDSSGDTVGGEGASVRMCRIDVTLDELSWTLKERSGGMVDILGKWCREI